MRPWADLKFELQSDVATLDALATRYGNTAGGVRFVPGAWEQDLGMELEAQSFRAFQRL